MSQYLTRQVLTRLKRLILPNTHQTKPHHSINMLLHHFPFKRNHRACFPFLKDRRQDIFKSNIHHVYIHIIIIIRIRNKLTSSSSSMCSHDHPPHDHPPCLENQDDNFFFIFTHSCLYCHATPFFSCFTLLFFSCLFLLISLSFQHIQSIRSIFHTARKIHRKTQKLVWFGIYTYV